ncbi:MAG: beta-ketoacyl-[acyl-carrier-protein] synthase II [Chlorobi bacterium]|nr:MAG: beta-ketoacyl-ACP synthase II [Bacteroidota bacterium]KXK33713.1 MAG: 3-oxoacyl-(acyl-carrier-protein) synthase II [Chlorobi bacterium OLB6]MBE2265525.1 beta-ketoacyl-ACP synthase II [Flavobacteriales bacterium]MBL1160693.1 beta-ketoacyl-[acyl-carrier-protein] synthase II [Chlorobiota bacterium]MBW7853044.1 beta-ketoacyl-ACP synthase II [Candidatus Kapabacteria bacterium]MCC6331467.1 beta-ketoacyl-ACP synthase II [Ignavibacteria bacterium]
MVRPRIVITGLGAVTPIGNTVTEFWEGMMQGKSGADLITRFDATDFDTRFACEVKGYDPLQHITRKEVQRMDLFTQFAMSAAVMAVDDSGINPDQINHERSGVVFGSGIGGMWTYHHQQQNLYERGGKPDRISPFFVPMLISDIAAGHIAIRYGLKGPNYATVSACATSSHAIGDAFMLMQRGMADMMLAGGAEAVVCPMGIGGFNAMKALSTRNDDPATASRPFDLGRDGFVMGEGGGILVLETLEHAMNRGAKIYAEIVGLGLTDDAFHITQPAPGGEGAVRSMRLAVQDAGLDFADIDYINAHGTSTPYNDKSETAAVHTVFGDHAFKLSMSSTKSMTGHLLGAAGAIEAIATSLAIHHQTAPPTINQITPDPDCDLDYVPMVPKARPIRAALSNTFGFGGHNATLCFKAFEP